MPELVAEDVHESDRRNCHKGDDDDVLSESDRKERYFSRLTLQTVAK